MERKLKVRFVQISLLIISGFIIFITYFKDNNISNKSIISETDREKIKQIEDKSDKGDTFFNIEYSGIDLSGNRYILYSKEATANRDFQEIVNMRFVSGKFYFKDDTVLFIDSEEGIYNNKTLDVTFEKNVKASYGESELFGDKIVYLNSERTLLITDNVIVNDERGTMTADRLLFDLEKKTLDISSYDNKINANINIK